MRVDVEVSNKPSPEEIAKRVAEFKPDDLFEDDCPLCQMLKSEPCDVVYDNYHDEEDEEATN